MISRSSLIVLLFLPLSSLAVIQDEQVTKDLEELFSPGQPKLDEDEVLEKLDRLASRWPRPLIDQNEQDRSYQVWKLIGLVDVDRNKCEYEAALDEFNWLADKLAPESERHGDSVETIDQGDSKTDSEDVPSSQLEVAGITDKFEEKKDELSQNDVSNAYRFLRLRQTKQNEICAQIIIGLIWKGLKAIGKSELENLDGFKKSIDVYMIKEYSEDQRFDATVHGTLDYLMLRLQNKWETRDALEDKAQKEIFYQSYGYVIINRCRNPRKYFGAAWKRMQKNKKFFDITRNLKYWLKVGEICEDIIWRTSLYKQAAYELLLSRLTPASEPAKKASIGDQQEKAENFNVLVPTVVEEVKSVTTEHKHQPDEVQSGEEKQKKKLASKIRKFLCF